MLDRFLDWIYEKFAGPQPPLGIEHAAYMEAEHFLTGMSLEEQSKAMKDPAFVVAANAMLAERRAIKAKRAAPAAGPQWRTGYYHDERDWFTPSEVVYWAVHNGMPYHSREDYPNVVSG